VTLPPPSILPPPSPERQLVFTLPPIAWAAQLVPPIVVMLFFTATGTMPSWVLVPFVVLLPVGFVMRRVLALVLDPSGVTVTIYRARTVPWSDVVRFEPGSNWVGGVRIVTTGGVLRSRVPCSSMGFQARPDQIAQLEAFRLRWSGAEASQ